MASQPSFHDLHLAAIATSKILHALGVKHCYIGGYAVLMFGGERTTSNVDVLVGGDVSTIRCQLVNQNPQFSITPGHELVYVLASHERAGGATRVSINLFCGGDNQPYNLPAAETVPKYAFDAEEMDLDLVADGDVQIPVLHPVILTLTRLRRWVHNSESTYPALVAKAKDDIYDLHHLLMFIVAKDERVDLAIYAGPRKAEFVAGFRKLFSVMPPIREVMEGAMKRETFELVSA